MTVYAILNESSAPELTHPYLLETAVDMQVAYDRDYAAACAVLPIDIVVCDRPEDVPEKARVFHIMDSIPEAPGALAFHTRDDSGRPVLKIGVDENRKEALATGGSFLDALTESMSHEIFETARNPYVNRWISGPWLDKKVADEASDPVQGSPYREGQTAISNFTLPAWSDPEDLVGPWDFGGVLKSPFDCAPTGYLPFDDGTNQYGEAVSARKREHLETYGRFARAKAA